MTEKVIVIPAQNWRVPVYVADGKPAVSFMGKICESCSKWQIIFSDKGCFQGDKNGFAP